MNQTETQTPEIDTKEQAPDTREEHAEPEIKNPAGLLAKNRELLAENRELRTRLADMQAQLSEAQSAIEGAKAEAVSVKKDYAGRQLEHLFRHSDYAAQKLAIPPELVQTAFAEHFTIDDGRIFVKRILLGNKAPSIEEGGSWESAEVTTQALFDTALEALVQALPWRDHILKGSGASGGGATGNSVSSSSFDAYEPPKPAKAPAKPKTFGLR